MESERTRTEPRVVVRGKRKRLRKPWPTVFGPLLRGYRKALNIGLEELAAATEINIGTLSMVERKKKRPPEIYPYVMKIAERLNLQPGSRAYGEFLNAAAAERFPLLRRRPRPDPLGAAAVVQDADAEMPIATGSAEAPFGSPAASPPAPTEPGEDSKTSQAGSAPLSTSYRSRPQDSTEAHGHLDASVTKAFVEAIALAAVSGAVSITVRTKGGVDHVFSGTPAQDEAGALGEFEGKS